MKKADKIFLYKPDPDYIPRVAAIHDLCGYGKCSLGVAIPVLSASGIDVCSLPTSLFSTHTLYPDFRVLDTTSFIYEILDHWKNADVELDGIYSGFLGSSEQVEIILSMQKDYPNALMLIDPVMGDGGMPYPTYGPELCQEMKRLCKISDVLLPNLTEASILTGLPYTGNSPSDKEINQLMDNLLEMGSKYVVLKGIERNSKIRNYIKGHDCELSYEEENLLPFRLHGTGDLYASSVVSAIYAGKSLSEAVSFAADLVHDAMIITTKQPHYKMRGVSFEKVLNKVTGLIS